MQKNVAKIHADITHPLLFLYPNPQPLGTYAEGSQTCSSQWGATRTPTRIHPFTRFTTHQPRLSTAVIKPPSMGSAHKRAQNECFRSTHQRQPKPRRRRTTKTTLNKDQLSLSLSLSLSHCTYHRYRAEANKYPDIRLFTVGSEYPS